VEEYECIRVPWYIVAEEKIAREFPSNAVIDVEMVYNLEPFWKIMPWFVYLLENAVKIKSGCKVYKPAAHTYKTALNFYLDPKKATWYRIKYAE
jgi:hypothetical protein